MDNEHLEKAHRAMRFTDPARGTQSGKPGDHKGRPCNGDFGERGFAVLARHAALRIRFAIQPSFLRRNASSLAV